METNKIIPWESKFEPGAGDGTQAELGHRLCERRTCSGEAVESLLKQQLWGQESKGGKEAFTVGWALG